ncbi:MAG: sigma-70 family RNA polymerase sigma factor [Deltaproteobacteria bacterium]|nr:sigma-70 family RNA polymerase sigma factor [Deltaproteobacteria bacterium]
MSDKHQIVEEKAKKAFEQGDFDQAATLFIQNYGNEIYAFLLGRLPSESDASEVLSEFAENFWQGLPDFKWRSSLRSWAYTIARNAAIRYLKEPHRRRERPLSLFKQSLFIQTIAEVRSVTKKYRRTEAKNKIRQIREKLSDEDQTLLVLRVDRQLAWRELAMIMSGQGENMGETEINRWSALLRQRFKKIKERLKKLARDEGLLDQQKKD